MSVSNLLTANPNWGLLVIHPSGFVDIAPSALGGAFTGVGLSGIQSGSFSWQ